MKYLLVAITFLALNFYVYHYMARSAVIPPRESFSTFPMTIGDWSCPGTQDIPDDVLENLGATDYLVCEFRHRSSAPTSVGFYVGYHETQVRDDGGGGAGENSIHPPAHCLPGSGWDIIDSRTVQLDMLDLPQERAMARRLMIAKGEARQLVYYWYQSRGRVITEDWKKILFVGWDRATRGRTDGSLVRFTIPISRDGEEAAEAAFRDLAPGVLALLPLYVPE